ncbi:MAG: glycoside hydrolase [Xanthomonadaceae bacterium]|nr:glycoside hydrolase [Xanthomonadaceae bacterium]
MIESPAGPDSLAPALAIDADRSEVIMTWLESVDDGHVLRFSRFDGTTFSKARDIARGSRWFANWADTPALFVAANGDFIAHWLEKSADSTYAYDIRLSHSADRGLNWSAPVTPHADGTPTEHGFVAYFERPSGQTGMV